MIFGRHANLKYKYGNRHFWCRGYYAYMLLRNKDYEDCKEYIEKAEKIQPHDRFLERVKEKLALIADGIQHYEEDNEEFDSINEFGDDIES